MKSGKFLLRVGVAMLLLLTASTMFKPTSRSSHYRNALTNFEVSSASASDCLLGLKCFGNPVHGYCSGHNPPELGCELTQNTLGCFGCGI
jgi:hypothetical protein